MKPTYAPKFISTIAALSLCVSSAVAHHSDTNWQVTGSNENAHSSAGDSNTTTITNLTNGIVSTGANAENTISSLIIKSETNNNNNPTLEIGNQNNNKKITVPNITIDAGANLNRTIQNPSNTNNRWNIIIRGSSTINTFENNGTISSSNNADTLYLFTDKDNGNTQTVIETFINNGTIDSKDQNAAIRVQGAKIGTFKNESGKLISATGDAIKIHKLNNHNTTGTITNFTNEGTIKSTGNLGSYNNGTESSGINLDNATIKSFTNKGTISSDKGNAVRLTSSSITTFINDTNGVIETQSTHGFFTSHNPVHAAVLLSTGVKVDYLDNKGTIKGKNSGITVMGNNYNTIKNLKNSGIITITNNAHATSAGILFANIDYSNTTKYHTIENTGTITGGKYGVYIEGGSIDNLKNSGTIEGTKDGIGFHGNGTGVTNTTIQNLEVEKGTIKGGENGINISKARGDNNHQTVVQNLTIAKDAKVEGEKGSGIVLGRANANGQQGKNNYKLTGQINVQGTLKGTQAGITNYGQLGSDNNGSQEVIVVGENGRIDGVVKNAAGGTLQGNITNKGSSVLEIDNQGKTGNKTVITNNGQGEIKIKDWKLENQGNGSSNGALKTLVFEGNNNITLEKLTISEGDTDITKVADAIQGSQKAQAVAHTQVQTSGGNGAVTITGDLLRGLVANIDGSKTAAAALNRTLIATATARATFLDTVM
ncbi:MAG: hypothetical protein MR629_05905, partial [Helicobacter sp.]|nr:hypothetical protein [Helicobacter sp.]